MMDLLLKEPNEKRFFFLLEIFNKLSIHISLVQKCFNLKFFTIQVLFDKDTKTLTKTFKVFNHKQTFDQF